MTVKITGLRLIRNASLLIYMAGEGIKTKQLLKMAMDEVKSMYAKRAYRYGLRDNNWLDMARAMEITAGGIETFLDVVFEIINSVERRLRKEHFIWDENTFIHAIGRAIYQPAYNLFNKQGLNTLGKIYYSIEDAINKEKISIANTPFTWAYHQLNE